MVSSRVPTGRACRVSHASISLSAKLTTVHTKQACVVRHAWSVRNRLTRRQMIGYLNDGPRALMPDHYRLGELVKPTFAGAVQFDVGTADAHARYLDQHLWKLRTSYTYL